MTEDKNNYTSDFNDAKYQILRLHLRWELCNNLARQGRLDEWKWNLDIIWRELAADAENPKDFIKIKVLNDKIAKSVSVADLYNALQTKDIFLRCLQERVGKGSKKSLKDEDEFGD